MCGSYESARIFLACCAAGMAARRDGAARTGNAMRSERDPRVNAMWNEKGPRVARAEALGPAKIFLIDENVAHLVVPRGYGSSRAMRLGGEKGKLLS